jgi:hypothetical protein
MQNCNDLRLQKRLDALPKKHSQKHTLYSFHNNNILCCFYKRPTRGKLMDFSKQQRKVMAKEVCVTSGTHPQKRFCAYPLVQILRKNLQLVDSLVRCIPKNIYLLIVEYNPLCPACKMRVKPR